MSRLFAAERPAAPAQLIQDVAVADAGARHLHPGPPSPLETEIGHHGHGHAAACQPSGVQMHRRQRDQLVAIYDLAGAVDGEHAVAVAVERERDVVTAGRASARSPRSSGSNRSRR